jgi:hypothetical protein
MPTSYLGSAELIIKIKMRPICPFGTLRTITFVQIEDQKVKDASMIGDGEKMVLLDETPYEPQFRLEHADVYVADAKTGQRKLAMKNFPQQQLLPQFS